jgi:N-acyl-D-amino-acid deacylase
MHDLVVRGGTLVDGTGLARRTADVAVRDGRIVAVGRLGGEASRRTIDADGLVVAPGIVDVHTHYDPQVTWDPYCDSSIRHGVTTVLAGNCGFSVAPCRPEDHDYLAQMFARVEGMDLAAFVHVDWSFTTFPEFLESRRGRLGLNFGCYLGHSALRRFVLGDAALERESTDEEIATMARLVEEAMAAGAMGFTSSHTPIHLDLAERPVPSRLSTLDELRALCDAVGRVGVGSIGYAAPNSLDGIDEADHELMLDMAARARVPVVIQGYAGRERRRDPEGAWAALQRLLAEGLSRGTPVYSLLSLRPANGPFTFAQGSAHYEGVPLWRELNDLEPAQRRVLMADPSRREAYRHAVDNPNTDSSQGPVTAPPPWDGLTVRRVIDPANGRYLNRTVADIAASEGKHPVDAMFDMALTDDLRTVFAVSNESAALRDVVRRAQHHDQVLPGISDGGAHLERDDQADWPTVFLRNWCFGEKEWTLEEAIRRITAVPASVCGIRDRGTVQVGKWGDLVLFDADALDVGERGLGTDRVTGTERFFSKPVGVRATIVNGDVVVDDGLIADVTPGRVVRPA